MRLRRPGLDEVVGRFASWRANKQGRLIPQELWRAALGLLDRHSPSAICRALRLDPARFKQMRQDVATGGFRVLRNGSRRRARRSARSKLSQVMVPSSRAFVEFPAVGVGVSGVGAAGEGLEPASAGCRLILESAAGKLTLLTRAPDGRLADAVCRFVLEAVGSDSRP